MSLSSPQKKIEGAEIKSEKGIGLQTQQIPLGGARGKILLATKESFVHISPIKTSAFFLPLSFLWQQSFFLFSRPPCNQLSGGKNLCCSFGIFPSQLRSSSHHTSATLSLVHSFFQRSLLPRNPGETVACCRLRFSACLGGIRNHDASAAAVACLTPAHNIISYAHQTVRSHRQSLSHSVFCSTTPLHHRLQSRLSVLH